MCSLLEGLEMLLVELQMVDLSFRPVDFGPVGFSRVVAGRGELLPLSYDKKENVLFYCRIWRHWRKFAKLCDCEPCLHLPEEGEDFSLSLWESKF